MPFYSAGVRAFLAGRKSLQCWMLGLSIYKAVIYVPILKSASNPPIKQPGLPILFFRGVDDGGQVLPLGNPNLVGEYHDRYELTDMGWRIAHRRIDVVFSDKP